MVLVRCRDRLRAAVDHVVKYLDVDALVATAGPWASARTLQPAPAAGAAAAAGAAHGPAAGGASGAPAQAPVTPPQAPKAPGAATMHVAGGAGRGPKLHV